MARYYYRRSPLRWVAWFLVAIPVVAYVAHSVYVWLIPLLPFAGAGLLLLVLVRVGFGRRR